MAKGRMTKHKGVTSGDPKDFLARALLDGETRPEARDWERVRVATWREWLRDVRRSAHDSRIPASRDLPFGAFLFDGSDAIAALRRADGDLANEVEVELQKRP